MDIIWLKDFEALVACKNFSRAAEERNVSQPAFSRRIRALENEIGVRLINRETLPLTLTPAGEVFLSQSRIMLRTYEETIERCQTIDAAGENVIRFAASQSLYMTHYKTLIAPLASEGGVDTDLNSTSWAADQFVSALQQGYCDVILTYWHPSMDFLGPLEVANFEYLTLSTDRYVPVSRTATDGAAEFAFKPGSKDAVPLLSYGAVSALRSVQEFALTQLLPRAESVCRQPERTGQQRQGDDPGGVRHRLAAAEPVPRRNRLRPVRNCGRAAGHRPRNPPLPRSAQHQTDSGCAVEAAEALGDESGLSGQQKAVAR